MKKLLLILGAFIIAITSYNTTTITTAEAASHCLKPTTGKYRKHKSKDQAKKKARASWRTQVTKQTLVLGYRHSLQRTQPNVFL